MTEAYKPSFEELAGQMEKGLRPDSNFDKRQWTMGEVASRNVILEQLTSVGNRELPIWEIMPQVVETLQESNRLILTSETGSGKTTQIPQALLAAGFSEQGTIYVVENRVAVAVETAHRVAEEMGATIGQEVGYLTGPEKKSDPNAKLVFVTAGLFKNIIRSNPSLQGVSTVIFDEFDERYLHMDVGAALVEKAQENGAQANMLLMSATLNSEAYSTHFNKAPVIEAEGRPFPVEIRFSSRDFAPTQVAREAAKTVRVILDSEEEGDILIFMPGKAEINDTIGEIKRLVKEEDLEAIPFHSQLSHEERRRVFAKTARRRIIVATNIAERGITFPKVAHVIDSGLEKTTLYDPQADSIKLVTAECAQDAIKQRWGRAGRVSPGKAHLLFTAKNHVSRPKYTLPEIKRAPLRDVVLQIKAMGYSREEDPIRLMDMPQKANWVEAKNQLRLIGALDPENEVNLSALGEQLAQLSCGVREGAMMLKAVELGCAMEAVVIAALRMSKPLLYRPHGEQHEADRAHAQFIVSGAGSDLITLVNAFSQAALKKGNYQWFKKNYVSWTALKNIEQNIQQLTAQLKRLGHEVSLTPSSPDRVRQAISAGFPDKVFESVGGDWYQNPLTGERCVLGNRSSVKAGRIIANEQITIRTRRGELPLITLATSVLEGSSENT